MGSPLRFQGVHRLFYLVNGSNCSSYEMPALPSCSSAKPFGCPAEAPWHTTQARGYNTHISAHNALHEFTLKTHGSLLMVPPERPINDDTAGTARTLRRLARSQGPQQTPSYTHNYASSNEADVMPTAWSVHQGLGRDSPRPRRTVRGEPFALAVQQIVAVPVQRVWFLALCVWTVQLKSACEDFGGGGLHTVSLAFESERGVRAVPNSSGSLVTKQTYQLLTTHRSERSCAETPLRSCLWTDSCGRDPTPQVNNSIPS